MNGVTYERSQHRRFLLIPVFLPWSVADHPFSELREKLLSLEV